MRLGKCAKGSVGAIDRRAAWKAIPAMPLNLDRLPTTLARLASAQAICKECARLAALSRDERKCLDSVMSVAPLDEKAGQ